MIEGKLTQGNGALDEIKKKQKGKWKLKVNVSDKI